MTEISLANNLHGMTLEKNQQPEGAEQVLSKEAYNKLFQDVSADLLSVKEGHPHKAESGATPIDPRAEKIDKTPKDQSTWDKLGEFPRGDFKGDGSFEFK